MKSNFEDKIRSQRQIMDVDEPDDTLIWQGISRELHQKRVIRSSFFWKAAAILVFLAGSSYVAYHEFWSPKQNIYNITLSEIAPGLSLQVSQYQTEIDEKWTEFDKVKPADTKQLDFFFKELEQLDEMYRQCQEDFYKLGSNERLIRAMLDNYEKRVRILDRMLMEIQKQKDNEQRQKQTEI